MVVSVFYSCSVEETDSLASYSVIDLNAADAKIQSRTTGTAPLCFRKQLKTDTDQRVGWLMFYVHEHEVQVDFRISTEYSFDKTNLSLQPIAQEEIDMLDAELPNTDQFEYQTNHGPNVNKYTYMISRNDVGQFCQMAGHALVTNSKGEPMDIWADKWNTFVLADFSNCGTWPDEPFLSTAPDVDFYAPLMAESSGEFPVFGNSSDTVSVDQDNPITEGYVDIPLVFSNIPVGLKNAVLKIEFTDLDLHTDIISSGGNIVEFKESLMLMDSDGKILYELNEQSEQDGDFTWTYNISDNYISTGEMQLTARVSASLALIQGNGISATNTMEYMKNISITGEVIIK